MKGTLVLMLKRYGVVEKIGFEKVEILDLVFFAFLPVLHERAL
jgi:hypothetical protein